MKTLIHKAALLAIASMLYISNSNAQRNNASFSNIQIFSYPSNDAKENSVTPDTKANFFELGIEILNDHGNAINATVKVFQNDSLIAMLNSGVQRNMNLQFEKNQHYMIQVQKSGYVTKSIVVSTVLDKENENAFISQYVRQTSISLSRKNTASYTEKTPVGVICYNSREDNFVGMPILPQMITQEKALAQVTHK